MTTIQNSIPSQWLESSLSIKNFIVVIGSSILIGLFGLVAIPLPFTPVPIATQAQVILLLAVILGSKRASLAVLCFLAQGAIGLPVFAGAKGGILHLCGPTGGYLLGYIPAAFLTGLIVEKFLKRTSLNIFYAMGVGNVLIYVLGLPWLSVYCGWKLAFQYGMLPFLIGDFLKLVIAGKAWRYLTRERA